MNSDIASPFKEITSSSWNQQEIGVQFFFDE